MTCRRLIFWLLFWAAITVVLVDLVPAPAGEVYSGNRPGYRYDQTQQSYVRVFVAEPVFVPVFVPSNLFINISPDSYPVPVTVSPTYVQQLQAVTAASDARLKALEESLRRMEQLLQGKPAVVGGVTPPTAGSTPPTTGTTPPTALPEKTPAQPNAAQPQVSQGLLAAAGVMQQMCAQCHTGPTGRGGLNLFNAQGQFDASTDALVVYAAVRKDRMPKGPSKLSPADKATIRAWALESE